MDYRIKKTVIDICNWVFSVFIKAANLVLFSAFIVIVHHILVLIPYRSSRKFYTKSYQNAIVTKVIEHSWRNNLPEIVIKDKDFEYSLFLTSNYSASSHDFIAGDRIFKNENSLNFRRLNSQNKIDTFNFQTGTNPYLFFIISGYKISPE